MDLVQTLAEVPLMAVSQKRARAGQNKISRLALKALTLLETELEMQEAIGQMRRGADSLGLSKSWCERFKIVADQLRRDWPKGMATEEPEAKPPAEADRGTSGGSSAPDPLRGLKLIG